MPEQKKNACELIGLMLLRVCVNCRGCDLVRSIQIERDSSSNHWPNPCKSITSTTFFQVKTAIYPYFLSSPLHLMLMLMLLSLSLRGFLRTLDSLLPNCNQILWLLRMLDSSLQNTIRFSDHWESPLDSVLQQMQIKLNLQLHLLPCDILQSLEGGLGFLKLYCFQYI